MDIARELIKVAKELTAEEQMVSHNFKESVAYVIDREPGDGDLKNIAEDYGDSVKSEVKKAFGLDSEVSVKWVGKPKVVQQGDEWRVSGGVSVVVNLFIKVPGKSDVERAVSKGLRQG